jgi:hypothetical protein
MGSNDVGIVFALMAIAASWVAWRHNPLYSTRSTLRMLVALVLLIAAAIFVIVEAINLTSGRSEGVQLGAMFGVIVVLTLAMIFSIQALSVPKTARLTTTLPSSAKVLSVFRQSFYRWTQGLLVFMAACAVLCWVLPGAAKFVVLALAGMTLLVGLILLPVLYVMDRRLDRSLTALELHPWVHWQYSPTQWQQWTGVQVDRAKALPSTLSWKQHWALFAAAGAAIIVSTLTFAPGSLIERCGYAIFCCVVTAAMLEFAAWEARRAPEKLRAKLSKLTPEAYFGQDGLYCNGTFLTWIDMSVYLTSASIDTRPPRSLLFCFDKIVFNPYGPTQTLRINQNVLVPADGEGGIARLQQELTQRCPAAHIELA